MIRNARKLFSELLETSELRKIDFKRDQYCLDDEYRKAQLIKDILCIANTAGGDGYILLGVNAEQGKAREVYGISNDHDSSDLEEIVNSVIEEPIQFDYYSFIYSRRKCALIHIPLVKLNHTGPKEIMVAVFLGKKSSIHAVPLEIERLPFKRYVKCV